MSVRRIKCATGNVLIDLDNEAHRAWITRRWVEGEFQREIGQSLGYKHGSVVNIIIEQFIRDWCPEHPQQRQGAIYAWGVDRKMLAKQAYMRWSDAPK